MELIHSPFSLLTDKLLLFLILCQLFAISDGCEVKQRLLFLHSYTEAYDLDLATYKATRVMQQAGSSYRLSDIAVDNTGSFPVFYVSHFYTSPLSTNTYVVKFTYNDSYEISSETLRLENTDMKCYTLAYDPPNRLLFCGSYFTRNVLYEIAVDGTYKRFQFESNIEILRVFNGFLYVNFKFLTIEQFQIPLQDTSPEARIEGWYNVHDFYVDGTLLYYSNMQSVGKPWFFQTKLPDGTNRNSLLTAAATSTAIRSWTKVHSSIIFADYSTNFIHRCDSLNATGSCTVIASNFKVNSVGRMDLAQFKCTSPQSTGTSSESPPENSERTSSPVSNSTAYDENETTDHSEDSTSIECQCDKESFYHTFVIVSVLLISVIVACIGLIGTLTLKVVKQRSLRSSDKETAVQGNYNYGETYADINAGANGSGCPNELSIDH